MRHFQDRELRRWAIDVDGFAIQRVRRLLDYDLLKILEDEGKQLLALRDDPALLVDIVYCLVKPQADEAGVSDVDFGRGMKGDCLDDAWEAVLGEIIDFFPNGRRRLLQTAALQAGIRIVVDEREKSKRLGDPPSTSSGASTTASRVAAAWSRWLTRFAGSVGWTRGVGNRPPG